MSDGSFSVDTDGLHLQMPHLQQLATRFLSLHLNLQARLEGLGECWGDDPAGKEFVEQYANSRDGIIDALGGIGEVVHSTADGVTTMAVNFERLESDNVFSLRNLDGGPHITEPKGRTGKK
ncbi:WXG100 family type VII secretion target [Kitasatospora sp. NPDC050543]|uniref:WXG100 family type VII secretion target n=1 Tax=Kitasatospora sp. NPDC050543 TaxID=3364054 RepID=UPI003794C286